VQFPPKDYDFCFAGIPQKAPCVATQWQTNANGKDEFKKLKQQGFLAMIKALKPQSLLVYTNQFGREAVEEVLPKQLPVVWCATRSRTRGQRIDTEKGKGVKANG
jgi:hypothetical protein